MKKIKIIEKMPHNYNSFIYLKNSIIMDYINYKAKIFMLDKKNFTNCK